MTQHSPGPWQIVHGYTALEIPDGFGIMAASAPDLICECGPCANVDRATINLANARLIAAAPDLLEACLTAQEAYDALTGDHWIAGYQKCVDDLKAAIAKATEAPNPHPDTKTS